MSSTQSGKRSMAEVAADIEVAYTNLKTTLSDSKWHEIEQRARQEMIREAEESRQEITGILNKL